MKNKTERNLAIAFAIFVIWGNLISIFLPTEEYGAVIKTVDFVSVLFLLTFLIIEIRSIMKDSKKKENEKKGEDDHGASSD